jgi:hypothetical protein
MRDVLRERIVELIRSGANDAGRRDALLRDLLSHQASEVEAFRRLLSARKLLDLDPLSWPALPTDVFRFARIAGHPPSSDVRVFRTSGTTSGERGAHPFRDLGLYDLAAKKAAETFLFTSPVERLVILAPRETDAPDSSLAYMLARFGEWFALPSYAWDGALDLAALRSALETDRPIAILGTAFALLFAEDALDRRYELPRGSFVMETGGTKGKTRAIDARELRAALADRYRAPVIGEYGMTELSSQLYDTDSPLRYAWPPWVRVSIVHPETLAPLPAGELGLVRIDDLANLDSVAAIQTSDVGRIVGGRLELAGRASDAVPRGCSLAIEEALG